MGDWKRVSWVDAEPSAARRERERMAVVAPGLCWSEGPSGGWTGNVPLWPFERDPPEGLGAFTKGQELKVRIEYPQSYPMAEPRFVPLDPVPPLEFRSWSTWHVLPNGGLCLLQEAAVWDGTHTAADLVPKASGWFLEYLLIVRGIIEKMTVNGIATDDSLDFHFGAAQALWDAER